MTAIVVAGGEGRRIGKDKNLIPLLGKPLLFHTLRAFEKARTVSDVILVVRKKNVESAKKLFVNKFKFGKIKKIVEGGRERQESVLKGLRWVRPDTEFVVVHDGARPLVRPSLIDKTVRACSVKGIEAVTTAVKATETVKKVRDAFIEKTLNRDELWLSQTPQVFRHRTMLAAHLLAFGEEFVGTDDVQLVERMDVKVKIIEGSRENLKITFPEDLIVAEAFLRKRRP
ncbi:MAG: 2-C-methyl-D-erythritol 4-phosphate cytidylyltransferase [Candidatus Eisenbacteria bacterium]|nr:2-C-methyl-D-erythritol 4-phosphate cytidylyltransferase [Candidatus Eisenbacteria bacterium]